VTDGYISGPFRDRLRDNASTVNGYDTLRYGWDDVVRRSCEVALEVSLVLRRKGWSGTPKPCGSSCAVFTEKRGVLLYL
jgi:hypothetical protein